jgi:hypothetical protein
MSETEEGKVWSKDDFGRRGYYVADENEENQGPVQLARKVELIVMIDGKQFSRQELQGAGLIAVVAKPDEGGVWVESVHKGGIRYTDHMSPETVENQALRPWQIEALGLVGG